MGEDETRAVVRMRTRGAAGWIVMDRHERRNALDASMVEGLVGGIEACCADPALRCIVLAAEGTAFCGGADLRERGPGRTGIRMYASLVRALLESPLPVVARVQGPAVAGGVGLVAACHLAVAGPRARFFTPEVQSGLYPLMVHALVEASVGRKRAFAMGLIGARLEPREALELGLVNAVVEDDELDATIDGWVQRMQMHEPPTLRRCVSALAGTAGDDPLSRVAGLQRVLDELDSRR